MTTAIPGAVTRCAQASRPATAPSTTTRPRRFEQEAFEAFLQRLRSSKDKSEFDSFMDERARSNAAQDAAEAAGADASPETGARPGEY